MKLTGKYASICLLLLRICRDYSHLAWIPHRCVCCEPFQNNLACGISLKRAVCGFLLVFGLFPQCCLVLIAGCNGGRLARKGSLFGFVEGLGILFLFAENSRFLDFCPGSLKRFLASELCLVLIIESIVRLIRIIWSLVGNNFCSLLIGFTRIIIFYRWIMSLLFINLQAHFLQINLHQNDHLFLFFLYICGWCLFLIYVILFRIPNPSQYHSQNFLLPFLLITFFTILETSFELIFISINQELLTFLFINYYYFTF